MSNSLKQIEFGILFVDDEEQARKYFKRAYSNEFNIFTAESVEEGKAVLKSHADKIGVMITDQRMPGGNGVVLLNHVKQNHPHIVRLLTTAYTDLEDAIEAVNSGEILRYIVKPWDLKVLHMELEHALRFFYIQNERDQLIGEKMNVWQRMTEINRVRDLLVMAGSFSHLDNAVQGIRSLLLQSLVSGNSTADEMSLDLWKLLEDEINLTLSIANSVKTQTQTSNNELVETSLSEIFSCLEEDPECAHFFQIENTTTWPPIVANLELLVLMFKSLSTVFSGYIHDDDARITMSDNSTSQQIAIRLQLDPQPQLKDKLFGASENLMIAFLIAAHHGGEIILDKTGLIGLEVRFPLGKEIIFEPVNEGFWLEEILSLYENQYKLA